MRRKRIYYDKDKKKYCVILLFKNNKELNMWYRKNDRTAKEEVWGVSISRELYKVRGKKWTLLPETGKVLLSLEHCGSGVVAHEIMHQIFWSYQHKRRAKQYPFIIKSMEQEEEILHRFSKVIREFYTWYWKVKKELK